MKWSLLYFRTLLEKNNVTSALTLRKLIFQFKTLGSKFIVFVRVLIMPHYMHLLLYCMTYVCIQLDHKKKCWRL